MILLFIISFLLYVFGDGLSDGLMKRFGTEKHWSKWPPRLGYFYSLVAMYIFGTYGGLDGDIPLWGDSNIDKWLMILIGMTASFKPLFDLGWSIGRFNTPCIYIGESDWTDKILRWMKLDVIERDTAFPILTFLYSALIIGGLLLIHYSLA